MLSILQRQAKQLEKELKERQQEAHTLRAKVSDLEHAASLKDERIQYLEAQLLLRNAAETPNEQRQDPTAEPGSCCDSAHCGSQSTRM